MKRAVTLTLALLAVTLTMSFAQDANLGFWKLNEAKSNIGAGAPKNTTVAYEEVGDEIRVTTDGTDASGKPTHIEWTGKFDGKYYLVKGDANSHWRSVKKIDEHTLELSSKKGHKVVATGRVVVSADGKTRTVTISGTNAEGKKYTSTTVYDKQ